ncbi:MAG: tetratricopeptide repeat protein [Oscillospiraceae bacterium]|jgi:tetratricopeptide (TPR) repeat protein|nr:tetratricopeptide repeat protein [Oscillospiraceae bacterium]
MTQENKMKIRIFIASGAETLELRNKVEEAINNKVKIDEDTDYTYQLERWEYSDPQYPTNGISQDTYNREIDKSDFVAVIITEHLGKYTKGEFEYARKLLQQRQGSSPVIVVYTLPSNSGDVDLHNFLQSLHAGERDYFHVRVNNPDELALAINHQLDRIKNKAERDKKAAIADMENIVAEKEFDNDLTKKAIDYFSKGDYKAASDALDVEKLRQQAQSLSDKQKEVAEAFVVKAKLVLIDVNNKDRFIIADGFFKEAIGASEHPDILFKYAYYLQEQNKFKPAVRFYKKALSAFRKDNNLPNVATTLNNLGNLHNKLNKSADAEKEYREALVIRRKLAQTNPDTYLSNVATILNNLGNMHTNLTQYTDAEKTYQEALKYYRKLAQTNPDAYLPDVAMTLNNLGVLHRTLTQYADAEKTYQEALDIRRKLAQTNTDVYLLNVADTLNNLGVLHRFLTQYTDAEKEYQEALDIIQPFYDRYPKAFEDLYNRITNGLKALP